MTSAAKQARPPVFYYLVFSFLSLLAIQWIKIAAGEINLPPLLPQVRLGINALYLNLAAAFYLAVQQVDSKQLSDKFNWALWAVVGALLCAVPPVFSGDLMEYLMRGRMLAVYHVSPYQHVPREFSGDILYPYCIWLDNPDSYGPLWVYTQALPALLFRDWIPGMIWGLKMLLLAASAAAIYYYFKILEIFGWNDAKLKAMFAWNPLVWVVACIDGRNDTLMLALTIVSFYFLVEKRFTRSFLFWTLAFLVKYTVLLILPFFVIYAVREEWRRRGTFPVMFLWQQALLSAALALLAFWPLWGGVGTFLALTRASVWFYTNTIPYAFHQGLGLIGLRVAPEAVKFGFLGAYGVFYALAIADALREKKFEPLRFVRRIGLVYLLFYLTIVIPFGFHYLLWALPWLILSRWPYDVFLVTLYAFAGLFSYFKRMNYLLIIAMAIYFGWLAYRRLTAQKSRGCDACL